MLQYQNNIVLEFSQNIIHEITTFGSLNAHNSAPRAAPELISKLIISEVDALSFDNNENICFM